MLIGRTLCADADFKIAPQPLQGPNLSIDQAISCYIKSMTQQEVNDVHSLIFKWLRLSDLAIAVVGYCINRLSATVLNGVDYQQGWLQASIGQLKHLKRCFKVSRLLV